MNSFLKWFTMLTGGSILIVLLTTVYICPRTSMCSGIAQFIPSKSNGGIFTRTAPRLYRFKKEDVKIINFERSKTEVMVFLHIQKTGGTTFGRHLVENLELSFACKCRRAPKLRCECKRPVSNKLWLFSRHSLGWPCGLHSDWTELHSCVPGYVRKRNGVVKNQKYLYVTFLREPLSRVLSEFRCYQRGTTWAASQHKCNGRKATEKEIPPCYEGETWEDVTVDAFVECKSNLAYNRQSRMLADLTLVNCYNLTGMSTKKRQKVILKSAIRNLRNMAYFGLTEYQEESQYLFEKTFGVKFRKSFVQKDEEDTRAADVRTDISEEDLRRIKKLNTNDIRIYRFAKELFFYRLKYFKDRDKEKAEISR